MNGLKRWTMAVAVVLTVAALVLFPVSCKSDGEHPHNGEHPSGGEYPSGGEFDTNGEHPAGGEHSSGSEHPE